jgi:hypothetical protein
MAKKVDEKETPKIPNDNPNLAGSLERDQRALKEVLDHIQAVDSDRAVLNEKWVVLDRLWRGDPISRFYPGAKTTTVPEPFKQERAATPRVKLALFPSADWYRPVPMRPGAASAKAVKLLMDEQLDHGQFDSRMTHFLQNCGKYGTSFAKGAWITDRQEAVVNEPQEKLTYKNGIVVDMQKKGVKRKTFSINRDRTEFKNLSIFDFRCDRRYESIYDAPCCSDDSRQTKEDVIRKIKQGIYAGITEKEVLDFNKQKDAPPESDGRQMQLQANGGSIPTPKPENDVLTTDWWGLFDLDGKGFRVECQIVVLNREKVVRVVKNNLWSPFPRRPYVFAKWTPVEGELYGIGLIEPITNLCLDLNDMQNTLNHAAALAGNPMYKVGDGMNVPDEQIIAAPGRIFRGEDISQMQPLHTPDTSQIARINKGELRDDISETNGMPRLFMGQMESGEESATGFAGRMKEGNLRIKEIAQFIAKNTLQPFMQLCAYNNQQFLDEERVVTISGDARTYKQFKVSPADLAGVARIDIILAAQIELLGIRGQTMMGFLQAVTANPAMMGAINAQELLKVVWTSEFGYGEVERIFPPKPGENLKSQMEENMMLARGLEIDVDDWDNHVEHMKVLEIFKQTSFYTQLDDDRKALVAAHEANHEMRMRVQEEQFSQMPVPGMEEGGAAGIPPEAIAAQGGGTPGQVSGRILANTMRGQLGGR